MIHWRSTLLKFQKRKCSQYTYISITVVINSRFQAIKIYTWILDVWTQDSCSTISWNGSFVFEVCLFIDSFGGRVINVEVKVMHLRMKFTALKKTSTHSKQVRGAWTIKVDFYLFLFGVLALFVLSEKSILESNNANAAKTKIKLLYSTVHLFFMIFLMRFQARHLSEKPLRCEVLAKSEYTNAFLQSWKVFPWRWSYVWVCCHVSRTCSDDVNRNFKIVPEMRWLPLCARYILFRTNGTVHAHSWPEFEWKNALENHNI